MADDASILERLRGKRIVTGAARPFPMDDPERARPPGGEGTPERLRRRAARRRTGEPEALRDLGEQREQRGHDLGLDVALALDADVLLQGHEGDARLGEGVEDGDDLTQRPAEPGEFADD